MNWTKKHVPASVPIEPFFEAQMKDPEFRRAYEELEPEFEIVRQLIELRLAHKITQKQLAQKARVLQPSIARLERRGQTKDLNFLRRVADALDADVKIQLVPRVKHINGKRVAKAKRGARKMRV